MSTTLTARRTLAERFAETFPSSERLYRQATSLFPNGVTHDLRYLQPFPIYVERAEGSHKWDADGHELVDWWSGHGSIMLGHSHPAVVEAVQAQMGRMTHPGACHELELEWGNEIKRLKPSVEKMRFVNSGTEATLMALRLAHMFTGKRKVLKFQGHFHGWHDFLIQAADPPYDSSVPGLDPDLLAHLIVVAPNDLDRLEQTVSRDKDVACVILEPTGGHYGQIPIRGEFLRGLREITARHCILLIFDEVITGFRVHSGGAQGYYGVRPDLTTMAKIVAGGLPGGCLGGRADVLDLLEFSDIPARKMPHPGTFNANPLSAAAGITTLRIVATGEPNRRANEVGRALRRQLNQLFETEGVPWLAYGDFSAIKLLTGYTGPRPKERDDSDTGFVPYGGEFAKLEGKSDARLKTALRQALLLNGVDWPGLACMSNASHSDEDVERTVDAVRESIGLLRNEGLCP
jgi:glutamate-1-semialdehyde 2,1-aminomutase